MLPPKHKDEDAYQANIHVADGQRVEREKLSKQ